MSLELSYYNLAASICTKIYDEIKGKILIEFKENNVKNLDILYLLEYGNKRILEETSLVFKKSKKTKGIACPISITTNNTVLYYTYNYEVKENPLNYIKETDIIKINLGVVINDCVANLCETFTIIENKKINKIIKCLNKITDKIEETIEPGEINDEIRILIESKCTEKSIFPIENCISFQHEPKFDEPKYLILNYKKKYDFNDNLLSFENLCFEYEKDEVYTIQISVVPIDDSDDPIVYKKLNNSHLYRFNENHYSLKLKSSREFLNECKSKHNTYLFDIQEYNKIVKNKIGINECIKNSILDEYPIHIVTQNGLPLPVITKIFTLLVTEEGCKILKY
jgi:methionine aminopeptidase